MLDTTKKIKKVTLNGENWEFDIPTQSKTATPTTSQQTITPDTGYYLSEVDVEAVTSAIDSNITQNNIKRGVTILGVEGNLEPDKPDQSKTATPTTSEQTITPDVGYELSSVTVEAVTSSIDSNITAENIKKDVTILGVTGTLESGGGLPEFMTASSFSFDGSACTGYNGDNSAEYVIVPKSYSIGGTTTTYQAYNNSSTNLLMTYMGDGYIQATLISKDGTVEKMYSQQSDYNDNFATDFPNGALLKSMTASDPYTFMDWQGSGSITPPIVCNGVTYTNASNFADAVMYGEVSLPLNFAQPKDVFIDGSDVNVTGIKNINGTGDCDFQNTRTLILSDVITSLPSYAFKGGKFKNIILPSTISSIGSSAFTGCSSLEKIDIPQNISQINQYTFASCTLLSNVNLPNSLSTIGLGAFSACSALTNINFPDTLRTINVGAFNECISLSKVNIPSSIAMIHDDAFAGTASLEKITVDSQNRFYDSRDNCNAIISTATNTLIQGCKNTIIPSTISTIGPYAFNGQSAMTSIDIPYNITTISNLAFRGCNTLSNIGNPSGVSLIGNSAFGVCSALTSVSFQSCINIEPWAFNRCTSLTTISFPACINIGAYAFSGCTALTTVDFPVCSSMGQSAFKDCASLTTVDFPVCTYVGDSAFQNCTALTTVSFPACSIVGGSMFENCTSLTTASFPACSTIANFAFRSCTALSALYLTKSVTLTNINAFYSTPMSNSSYLGYYGSIYVPASLLTWYRNASNWSKYSSRITTYTPT